MSITNKKLILSLTIAAAVLFAAVSNAKVYADEADCEEDDEQVTQEGQQVVADALKQQPDHGDACQDAPGCLFVPPQHKISS